MACMNLVLTIHSTQIASAFVAVSVAAVVPVVSIVLAAFASAL